MDSSKPVKGMLIDPEDGLALRTFLESLRGYVKTVRVTLDPHWEQLRLFFDPMFARWNTQEVNNMSRQDYEIINETGTQALSVLQSGMLTGMTPTTRDWFGLVPDDPNQAKRKENRIWCELTSDVIRETMLKSNYYETMLEMYGAEGLYGTCAFLIESDKISDIRCHPYPTMSYWLGVDDTLRVDLVCRELMMTARNLVEKFGRDNVSPAVLTLMDSNAGGVKETYYPVAHFIMKGSYFDPAKSTLAKFPWISIYYEIGNFNPQSGILRKAGYLSNPLIAGRWQTVGENIYGMSPAMKVLGSTMSLQAWEERLAQGAEKGFNPPMVADSRVDPRKLTMLPGEFSFVDFQDGKPVIAPAYNVNFQLDAGIKMVERIEARINEGMFKQVFQLFTDSTRREITAEEVRAKAQEKMSVLGPVIERNLNEVHGPSIMRILDILMRIPGRIPPLPEAMKGRDGALNTSLKLQFKSILAQAAQMVGMNNISQVMTFAVENAQAVPSILDNLDTDKMMVRFAEKGNMDSDLIREPDEVAKMRAARQKAQQQQQLMENAKPLAQAAQAASQTPTAPGSNLLKTVAPNLAGGEGA